MKRIGTLLIVLFFVAGICNVKSQDTCKVPTNLKHTSVGEKSATITWNGTSDSLFVVRFRIVDPNITYNWLYRKVAMTVNTLDLKPLLANTTYEVQVRAFCHLYKKSDYTDTIQFKTDACQEPFNLTVAKVTANEASLSWSGNAHNFVVRYAPIGSGVIHYKNVKTNNILLKNLAPLTAYTWSVKAVCISDKDTLKAYATGLAFSTQGCAPPSLVIANDISYKSANIVWNKNPYALSYIVKYYYDNPDSMANHTHYKKTLYNYKLLKSLVPNSKYIVQVGVFCSNVGTKDSVKIYGDTMSFMTLPKPFCSAPDGLQATSITGTSAKLSWNTCPNAVKYQIKYTDNVSLRTHCVNIVAADVPYVLGNLHPNLTYTWQVFTFYKIKDSIHHTDFSVPATFTTTKNIRLMSMSSNDNMDVQVYPNPSNGVFTITVNSPSRFDIQIFNMTGKLIHSEIALPPNYMENINLEGNPQGVYFIRIMNGNEIRTSKLVIQ